MTPTQLARLVAIHGEARTIDFLNEQNERLEKRLYDALRYNASNGRGDATTGCAKEERMEG